MNAKAKVCLEKLLKGMDHDDLFSLANTVTKGLIEIDTLDEAVKNIIICTTDIEELFKRQKMTKKVLLQYLVKENVTIDPKSEKHTVIMKIFEFWSLDPPKHFASSSNGGEKSSSCRETKSAGDEFAIQYSKWFYSMLNNDTSSDTQPAVFLNTSHFYPDCKLKLLIHTDTSRADEFESSELVCKRFIAFRDEEMLTFNPNLEEGGTKSEKSEHGLIAVRTCGTIHRGEFMLGIFEQRFGLVKDPSMDNNWKIKFTNLAIKSSSVKTMPVLHNTMMLTDS